MSFSWLNQSKDRNHHRATSLNRQRPNSSLSASSSGLSAHSLSRKHRPDYALLIISLLSVAGLIVVYAISPGLAATKEVSNNYFVTKQVIAIGLGLAIFVVASSIPVEVLKKSRNALIVLMFVGVAVVQIAGEEVNGATRWIQVGGLSFQIAEMIKFTLIVWLALFLVERLQNGEIANTKKTLQPLLIVMALIGLFVAKLESDLGSTGVMIAIIGVLALAAGLPFKRIALITAIVAVGTLVLVSTSSYRRDRVETFLNPQSDCQASGYQACQALIAVGSGGMFGLGLGSGVQAYGYLPEAANDSIFAILAEKFGFIGVALIMGLYLLLFSRFRRIIDRTRDPFSRLFVAGVLVWISTQAIINIGAMIGLLPLKGITLPFISYGGTSILFVMAALGVVFQISRYTSFEPIRSVSSTKNTRSRHMTIVLCGGGSGGHITPLLAVARELRSQSKSVKIIYIGERGGKFAHIAVDSKLFDELYFVSAGKLRRYHGESLLKKLLDIQTNVLNLRDMFKLAAGLWQGYRLLGRLKPDAILLKGGFVCVPIALAARAHHVPYITHDSDALPGLSNRIAARWARYHATAMPAQYYQYPPASIRVVGVPTDSRFRPYTQPEQRVLREKYGVPASAPIVLITGGSNGARRLNTAVIDALPKLYTARPDLYLLWQIGAGNEDQVAVLPSTIKKQINCFGFTSELFHMSAIADVVVTRAGATTIADFGSQAKACIVVPNPDLTGGHQLKNATVYADANAAVIINEAELLSDTNSLCNAIVQLLKNPEKRAELSTNLRALSPNKNAAKALASLLHEITV